jgi:hypothetical protein
MENFVRDFGHWIKTRAVIVGSDQSFEVGILLKNDSLSEAFLFFKENEVFVSLIKITFATTAMRSEAMVTFLFGDYDNYAIKVIVPNFQMADALFSQVIVCSRIATDISLLFKEENSVFIKRFGKKESEYPLQEKLAPLFPIEFDKEAYKTWIRRENKLNYGFYTKKSNVEVSFVSWNIAENQPPEGTVQTEFIFKDGKPVVFISLQEVDFSVSAMVTGNSALSEVWHTAIQEGAQLHGYNSLYYTILGGVHIELFVHKSFSIPVVVRDVKYMRLGVGGTLCNKSAIFLTFTIGESTLTACGCHLTSQTEQIESRNIQMNQIINKLDEINSQFKFIAGDLNYRIELPYDEVIDLCEKKDISSLLAKDQLLNSEFSFTEGTINFLPTYKFDDNCDVYDTSKKRRVPSWTDRVLFLHTEPQIATDSKSLIFETDIIRHITSFNLPSESLFGNQTGPLNYPTDPEIVSYESFTDVRLSDHRPVRGVFKLSILEIDEEKKSKYLNVLRQRMDELSMLAIPRLRATPNSFVSTGEDTVEITNTSCSTVEWKLEPCDGLIITPESGTVSPCTSQNITIKADGFKSFALVSFNIVNGNPLFIEVKEN